MTIDPLSTLFAAIPGLAKAGADIAAASDDAKRNAQLIEFQKAIINANALIASVQQQNASLLRQKDDLEQQIVRMKDWEHEKQRYALATVLDGIIVCALKESVSRGEPAHWLCANCFNVGKKSLLNTVDGARNFSMLVCPVCNSKMQTEYRGVLRAEYAHG